MSTQREDEFARQRALDLYRVVDTLPETAYDDIVRIATLLCDVPSALISLIDRDRQWFKARTGFALSEGARQEAFCDHAIRRPGQLMEVPDARQDPRFANNPLVTGGPEIRFYAGMPLVTPGGAAIGTVCVLDSEPRMINDKQREGLASLARLTMNVLDARRREHDVARGAQLGKRIGDPTTRQRHSAAVDYTLILFEVQELAVITKRSGERTIARALQRLHDALEAGLRVDVGDSISHTTGSAELIVVLHGNDAASTALQLRDSLQAIEREFDLHVLSASAQCDFPDEPVESVFLRADEALSHAKDAYRAQQAQSKGRG